MRIALKCQKRFQKKNLKRSLEIFFLEQTFRILEISIEKAIYYNENTQSFVLEDFRQYKVSPQKMFNKV